MARLSSSNLTSSSTEPSGGGDAGRLEVVLPHWTAKVQIYDNLYQPVARDRLEVVRGTDDKAHGVAVTLAPGVYTVEVTLDGYTETQLVVVPPGHTTRVGGKAWAAQALDAPMPFVQADIAPHAEIEPAEEASRTLTWIDGPGGDSRLFLFLHRADPQPNPRYADAIRLLDARGEVITDFAEDVVRRGAGWLAFNADLPAGYYILQHSRGNVRRRHQAAYLCAGWETHVFLTATRNDPSLSTMTMQMARRGAGVDRNDDAATAADAVLDTMRRGSRVGVVTRERIIELLSDKEANPWLGILAGYALLRVRTLKDADFDDLIDGVLRCMEVIGDHPDVRALRLAAGVTVDARFPMPPLLRDGLEIVHRHSLHQQGVIPLQSLTDLVLEALLPDSPWVAWGHLAGEPQVSPPPGVALEAASAGDAVPAEFASRPTAATSAPLYTQAFVQSASPRLPVYQMPSSVPEAEPADKRKRRREGVRGEEERAESARTAAAGFAAPATVTTVRRAPVLWVVQEWTLKNMPQAIPERIDLDSTQMLTEILLGLSDAELSESTHLTLERVTRGRAGLLSLCEEPQAADALLTPDETAVFEVVVQRGDQRHQPATPAKTSQASKAPATSVTIEECVTQLFAAADMLGEPVAAKNAKPVKSPKSAASATGDKAALTAQAEDVVARLRRLADALLLRADYILLTAPDGELLFGNGAFLSLLSPPAARTPPSAAIGQKGDHELEKWRRALQEARLANQRKWQAALKGLPTGTHTLADPAGATMGKWWQLRRTEIVDTALAAQSGGTAPVVAYLNTLHYDVAPTMTLSAIQAFQRHIAGLTLNASMFAYGTKDPATYLRDLAQIVTALEEAVAQSAR